MAAGTYFLPIEFTNTSGRACQLAGYPAVAFTTGQSGQQIGTEAAVDRAVPARSVLLAPGGVAHAWLQILDTANYPAGKCHPVTAAGLRVVAPGTQDATYVAALGAGLQGRDQRRAGADRSPGAAGPGAAGNRLATKTVAPGEPTGRRDPRTRDQPGSGRRDNGPRPGKKGASR